MTTGRIAHYRTILFDLNGTLAHDHDRFGVDQDYHATYRRLGGHRFGSAELHKIIEGSLKRLILRYEHGRPDNFPAYRDFISQAQDMPETELQLLEDTVAEHEIGRISSSCVTTLKQLSRNHMLGMVSDLWAPAHHCRRYFREEGLDSLFNTLVFSCEEGAVKPSRTLFMKALSELGADPGTTLFVGNDLRRDIKGAASCGMRTVWVCDRENAQSETCSDYVIGNVDELRDF